MPLQIQAQRASLTQELIAALDVFMEHKKVMQVGVCLSLFVSNINKRVSRVEHLYSVHYRKRSRTPTRACLTFQASCIVSERMEKFLPREFIFNQCFEISMVLNSM